MTYNRSRKITLKCSILRDVCVVLLTEGMVSSTSPTLPPFLPRKCYASGTGMILLIHRFPLSQLPASKDIFSDLEAI